MKKFSDRLKELRTLKGVSQAKLAQDLEVSAGLIGMYESDKRKPSYDMLEMLGDYFNVNIDYLTGREDGSTYYLDPEVAEMAQRAYEDPDTRLLLDASRDLSKEDMQYVLDLIRRLKGEQT